MKTRKAAHQAAYPTNNITDVSQHTGGGGRRIPWLEDLHARAIRILEAFEDGDHGFVQVALEDLADDLRGTIEAEDRCAA